MNGVSGDAPALYCTGIGLLPWKAPSGDTLLLKCYYSAEAAETIISPTDAVITTDTDFNAWTQHSNIDTGKGFVQFHRRTGPPVVYPLHASNGLWYTHHQGCTIADYEDTAAKPTMRKLTTAAMYELYHQRLGHPGERTMKTIHHHMEHISPLKGNSFYKCASCIHAKMKQRTYNTSNISPQLSTPTTQEETNPMLCGQHFSIDYGFMKGTGYCPKDEEGRTITSIDGYRSYCLIVDRQSRYTWIFLTKTKTPPLQMIAKFLQEHGTTQTTHRTIRTDQGGELWASQDFRKTIYDAGYLLEPTGAGAPFQNGMAERPNQTLGQMVRCMLHSSGLGPEYWSFALTHAVYLKNRLPHAAINTTPYYRYTGNRPSGANLRIFGSPVIIKNPGKRPTKLDLHTSTGRFLGFTATEKNIYYMDSNTRRLKIATHVVFDEAGMTLPPAEHTPAILALQKAGYSDRPNLNHAPEETPYESPDTLQVHRLTQDGRLPQRATDGSAGYDLYSPQAYVIPPQQRICIPLDIAVTPPPNTYIQLASRSSLATKHLIDVKAGVIDSDYTGNIMVVLHNCGETPFQVNTGDRIAQMLLLSNHNPSVQEVTTLAETTRGNDGFGSTGTSVIRQGTIITNTTPTVVHPAVTETQESPQDNPSDLPDMPFDIYLSTDPFDQLLLITIPIRGEHPTLGLSTTMCPSRNRLRIIDMALSTPASRIPKWRSTLRNAYVISVQGQPIHDEDSLLNAIKHARQEGYLNLQCVFATDKSYGIHPQEGIPQLYFDQLNIIAQHLQNIRKQSTSKPTVRQAANPLGNPSVPRPEPEPPPDPDRGRFFKLKELKQRSDWSEWKQSKFKMLDQYHEQGMFSQPMALPAGAHALHMLWTYFLKLCGTRKSRMVCNGNPRQKGTVTLGHTYANALDAASERLFWALVAKEGLIAVGADVTNAFAEAPPPKAPLYLYIDEAFRQWWTEHLGNEPIPPECNVVRVHNAIQGHPESPRLWEKHIDGILRLLGLKPTTHEPCLYAGYIDEHRLLFLRQVDDFAVAATTKEAALNLITRINNHMRMEVKHLGIIDRFNGMDIHQTQAYIKITCEKYLYNMLKQHNWLPTISNPAPVPLPSDTRYIAQLEQAEQPKTQTDKDNLKRKMGFSYRQVIGEVIYPMMKCRPDIAYHATKLSQYMENPAEIHYIALHQLCDYLAHTIHDGIYFWRDIPRSDLPLAPYPSTHPDNYTMAITPTDCPNMVAYVDADWATDTKHRKSVSGMVLMYAGGVIGYKTKYQDTIALSSTEAEFTAACDAAKMILFFRSLLDDLGIEQRHSTVLYEDNNGALMMANAQQPTRRTRHMDIKKFALLSWVEQDLITLHRVNTSDNTADGMTKALAKQLFYRHSDTMMGSRIPTRFARSTSNSSLMSDPPQSSFSTAPARTWGGEIRTPKDTYQ